MQRYVSKELSHFVGCGKAECEQFKILTKILRDGWLKSDPGGNLSPREFVSQSGSIWGMKTENETEALLTQVVCFCDIPLMDLPLHMDKYSRFGLAFPKAFLVEKGASPVMYVAENAASPCFLSLDKDTDDLVSRKEAMESAISHFDSYTMDRVYPAELTEEQLSQYNNVEQAQERERLRRIHSSFVSILLNYVKYFDDSADDEDEANVYMEREWRIPLDVKFALSDVSTVFLPKSHAEKFRNTCPEYGGQLIFSDQM
ncbi:MAG: abortive infection system antitoxin AbiGi family protein [Actinomycetota bacterium]|nr:abortive infection system antitoxin AbiGi family protein [Actinomycetota bacterium]